MKPLSVLIEQRVAEYLGQKDNLLSEKEMLKPLQKHAKAQSLSVEEFIILLLALVPHVQPTLVDNIIQKHLPQGGDFAAIGGVRGTNHRGLIPTGETALFVLAGADAKKRVAVQKLLLPGSKLAKENIVILQRVKDIEPPMSGELLVTDEFLDVHVLGRRHIPQYGQGFPAKLITTSLSWNDVVLNERTLSQVNDIVEWMKHGATLMNDWQMNRHLKQGYRVLFTGPPGTGKTLTASLLGKELNKEVYRIDLSQVVSKYIGETEKNLEKIFVKAENKDWILFFDEADALFGKRTSVKDAHDRYANQEVAYLLQRIEDFPGLIILASNFKGNIDQAFTRRFNSIIHFLMPAAEERYTLWKKIFPPAARLENDGILRDIANRYELTGSGIVNAVQHASLRAISHQTNTITSDWLLEGIRKEYEKEDRVFVG